MTDFATDLLWEDEKQPVLPVPAQPHEHDRDKGGKPPAPIAPAESRSERLQRIAGNAVLAREAEEAEAARRRLAEAARRPETKKPPPRRKAESPVKKRGDERRAKAAADPKETPAAREKAAQRQAAEAAVAAEAQRLSTETKQAAARFEALDQVLASFAADPGKADVLGLALLVEQAPPGIPEAAAGVLARSIMRADPAQRAAIAMRLKTQLADRRDLRLTRLLIDRFAGFMPAAARPAPPPPPAPPG